jgi:8-oxo-dGTP pyrophosphatase MutT (NUDIX family)
MDDDLRFDILGSSTELSTPIFDIVWQRSRGPHGKEVRFVLVEAPRWANVAAVVPDGGRDCFVMVRQYRHGLGRAVWEFPGGMVEEGEDEALAAGRELEEETGWRASSLTLAGRVSPNAAFMTNTVATYIASGLTNTGKQHFDENEFIRVGLIPVEKVIAEAGSGEFDQGILLIALWFWQRAQKKA